MRQSRPSPWIATLATFLVGLLACGDDSSSPSDAGSKTDSSVIDAGDGSLDAGSGDARQVTDSASETGSGSEGGSGNDGGSAPALNYPLLATYNLGGNQTLYAGSAWQTWAGQFQVNIVSHYIGLEQSMGETMSAVFASVKAHGETNGTDPKCLIYTIDETLPAIRGGAAATNGTYLTLWDAVNTNNWWLHATFPSGAIEPNPFSNTLSQVNNGVDTTADGSGLHAMQHFAWYWDQIFIQGNATKIGESSSIAADPNCDGFFRDNQFWTPRVSGDWLENGTTQTASAVGGDGNPVINPVIQQGHAQAIAAQRGYDPSLIDVGNCDWFNSPASVIDPSCKGLYDGQLFEAAIGESYSPEEYAGFDALMTRMTAAEPLLVPGGFAILGQYDAAADNAWPQAQSSWNASHYQAMRYGLSTALQRGYYYGAESGNPSTLWYFDENNGGSLAKIGYLGAPTDPPQTAAWLQGVWRRRYENGTAYVNPKGNGAQTVALGDTEYHLHGTEQPTVNTGMAATSITLQNRDGIIMLASAPP